MTTIPISAFRDIARTVCNWNFVAVDEAIGPHRLATNARITNARRQIALAALALFPDTSIAHVAQRMNRNHTTILHSIGRTRRSRRVRPRCPPGAKG
jgi:chromosomal replication initiation ATPase DnaA